MRGGTLLLAGMGEGERLPVMINMRCMCRVSRKNTADDRLKVTGHPPFREHRSGMCRVNGNAAINPACLNSEMDLRHFPADGLNAQPQNQQPDQPDWDCKIPFFRLPILP